MDSNRTHFVKCFEAGEHVNTAVAKSRKMFETGQVEGNVTQCIEVDLKKSHVSEKCCTFIYLENRMRRW